MQTFLPYPDFSEAAKCLDNKRLNKQFIEARQILKTLLFGGGWANHPAVLMWKGYEGTLLKYCEAVSSECDSRKFKITFGTVQLYKIVQEVIHYLSYSVPEWLGNEKLHSSHRSRLLCKGYADSVCAGLKTLYQIKCMDTWLKQRFLKTKNQLKFPDIKSLEHYYYLQVPTLLPQNYYKKFGWTDDPSNEYFWPVKKNQV